MPGPGGGGGVAEVAAVPDRVEVRLPRGARVLVCSDLHLAREATEASRCVTGELAQRIATWDGPAAVVLNGDCFELLAATEPSIDAVLDAHPAFAQALLAFGADAGHQLVVTVGNHDGRIAWDAAVLSALQMRLGATVALSADLLLETDGGVRVVRVEHGHRFDPANAFHDPRDPYDTPLGHHVVQEVLPEMETRPFLQDVPWLSDPGRFPQFLGSRVVYRELVGRLRWLALPFVAALLIRTPVVVRGLSDATGAREVSRWLLVAGIGIAVDAAVLGVLAVLIARRVFRALASSRLGPRGSHLNEPPRTAAQGLCAQGFAGFVTGHTHHPELTPLPAGFYANSGCGVQAVDARPGHAGLPPVFTGVLRRSWVELEADRDLEARLLVGETPVPGATRLERLVARRPRSRPSSPEVVGTVPAGAGWPVDHAAFRANEQRVRNRRLASGLVLVAAVVGVLSSVTPPLRGRLHALLRLMPVELPQAASAALVFGSIGLVVLARGLRRGHRLAWLAALAVLATSTVLHVVKGGDVEEAVVALVIGAWLARHHDDFPVRPDTTTVRTALVLGLGGAAAGLGLSVALVAAIGAHRRTDVDESLRALAERLAGRQVLPVPASTPFVVPALTAVGIGLLVLVASTVLGPRRQSRVSPAEHRADRRRARGIVRLYGGDTLAYFALRDDKAWFFTGSSVVAYAVRNGVCVVSPDPVGPAHEWADTWAEFSAFADGNGWSVAVVGAQPGWLAVYEAAGMRTVYMGDEAIIDCQAFSLQGGAMKALRGAYNRVKKAGFTTLFLDPAHLDPAMERELRQLMTETRHGEAERGFSMTLSRVFDPDDDGLLLSVALDGAGRPAAFCQWVPAADIDGWSLDLMRRRADPDLPNGVTDFVVIETIEHLRAAHKWGLGLNFAVMRSVVAGERAGGFSELERRVLHKFSETMQIESLWRYNLKYQPYWRPRYVVLDAVEHAAAQGIAIADVEAIWELPVIGRFLGRRR